MSATVRRQLDPGLQVLGGVVLPGQEPGHVGCVLVAVLAAEDGACPVDVADQQPNGEAVLQQSLGHRRSDRARGANHQDGLHARGEGARLRGELIDAASRLLAELGDAERLSVRAVARAAGVTAPSTYRHFPDKRSLVRAVVEERFRDFDRVLDQAQAGSSDPFDALKRRCRAYLRFAREHPGHYRVLFSATSLGPKGAGTYGRVPHPGRHRS